MHDFKRIKIKNSEHIHPAGMYDHTFINLFPEMKLVRKDIKKQYKHLLDEFYVFLN